MLIDLVAIWRLGNMAEGEGERERVAFQEELIE